MPKLEQIPISVPFARSYCHIHDWQNSAVLFAKPGKTDKAYTPADFNNLKSCLHGGPNQGGSVQEQISHLAGSACQFQSSKPKKPNSNSPPKKTKNTECKDTSNM
jgi:hypothetical protein